MISIRVLSEEKIISRSWGKTIKVWSLKSNSCVKRINAHSDIITDIKLLSDEKVVSCSEDKTIKTWYLDSATCIKTFEQIDEISSIALN